MPVYVKNETIWKQMMPSILGAAFLLLTLFFNNQMVDVLKHAVSPSAQMEAFQAQRAAQISAAEFGSDLLRSAAALVDKTPSKTPRDAAICLTARRLADEAVSDAMNSAKDSSAELDRWNLESRVTENFCAYAMRAGDVK